MAPRRTCYWHIAQAGLQMGPMSLAELREAILRGATTSDLRVRRSDEEGYRLPAEHPELADLYQGDGGDPNSTSAATPRALRRAR